MRVKKLAKKINTLPGEGKGMTRKAKRLFNRLDEKLILYNGLTRYKLGSFLFYLARLKAAGFAE
uniref:hypothetical protein n=1 Tax=Desulforadius tongensis TaxID=1216062 RepID=UPI001956427C|nr:hypothetical protein [Desulforadius tongensis]